MRSVGDVKAHEFEPPLGDATGGLTIVDDVPQATRGNDYHRVAIKVMPELALGDEHGVEELLNSQVAGLRVKEDLADEVHRLLGLEGVTLLFAFHHQG